MKPDNWLWESYIQRKQKVAIENWGIDNEIRAFLVSPDELNATNLHNFQSSGKQFSTSSSIMHNKFNSKVCGAKSQMLVCRVVVGRVFDECGKEPSSRSSGSILKCHSEVIGNGIFSSRGPCLAYPEYIINYRDNSARVPQHLGANAQQTPGRSESKMCVVCMERPVRYLTLPCGYVLVMSRFISIVSICINIFMLIFVQQFLCPNSHPCLCEKCNDSHIKSKLRSKCPECRNRFSSTAIIYGRVVNDE